jgi:hypothetical protein
VNFVKLRWRIAVIMLGAMPLTTLAMRSVLAQSGNCPPMSVIFQLDAECQNGDNDSCGGLRRIERSGCSVLDAMADRIFNERHPELRGRKIRADETGLAQEWLQIRRCEAVVDYTFYQRHPGLRGRKIRHDETALAREWQEIRQNYYGCQ